MAKYIVTADGLVPAGSRHHTGCYSPTDTAPTAEGVALARCALAELYQPARTAWQGSYGLKHTFERTHGYVTNGELVAAALELGFRVEPDGGGINARVYVKRRRGP